MMKHFPETFVALLVIAAAGSVGCAGPAGAGPIDPARARELVVSGATLLDVRTPGEWSAGHLEGAVLVPIATLDSRLAEIPRDHPVVVYCASGVRSAAATATLRAAGYDAHDLGGMARWGR